MRTLVFVLALALLPAAATAETWRATSEVRLADDSDGMEQYTVVAGARRRLDADGDRHLGAGVGRRQIADPDGRVAFDLARVEFDDAPTRDTRIEGQLETLRGNDWSPTLGSARLTHRFERPVYVEVSAARTLVDTVYAVRRRWTIDGAGLSVDLGPVHGWTLVGAYTHQDIDDGNERDITVGRLIHEPAGTDRWVLEARVRSLDSAFDATGYFSPRDLDEYLMMVTYRRPVLDERWFLSLRAGVGEQYIDDHDGESLYVLEAEWRGWFSDHWGLESRAACMNTVELNTGGSADGYRYCSARVALMRSW